MYRNEDPDVTVVSVYQNGCIVLFVNDNPKAHFVCLSIFCSTIVLHILFYTNPHSNDNLYSYVTYIYRCST